MEKCPYTFTHAQRLYAFIILFPNVIAWLYSIGTIISLFVDPQFRAVLARSRFSRRVRRISSDFYIVCGFGHTGRMIVSGLLKRGISAVVLEREESIIHSMALHEDFSHLPAQSGDVTDRRLLDMAGLSPEIKNCIGVIAITNDDHANLTIAITSKLLRPELPVAGACGNPPGRCQHGFLRHRYHGRSLHDFCRTFLPGADRRRPSTWCRTG